MMADEKDTQEAVAETPVVDTPATEPTVAGEAQAQDSGDAIRDISPRELSERIARGEDIQLIDVREKWEWDISRIPGAKLIPLGAIREAAASLDRNRETVLYCKVGARSLYAADELTGLGFTKLANLSGGILRWSEEVDPTVLRY